VLGRQLRGSKGVLRGSGVSGGVLLVLPVLLVLLVRPGAHQPLPASSRQLRGHVVVRAAGLQRVLGASASAVSAHW
jgi:hypothetical protein